MHGMRPFGALISREDALARLLDAVRPVAGAESLALADALGRVAAVDVAAPVDVPPFARATMDGYALRAADASRASARLTVAGVAHAGRPFPGEVPAGAAVRIATGAPVPPGCDAVIRVEDTSEEAGFVGLHRAVVAGQSVDAAGSDLARGASVVRAGDTLTPARLGLLASVGISTVAVGRRPRVVVISSGDELLAPGEPPAAGRIYDANTTTLRALLRAAGCEVHAGPRLRDDLMAQRDALRGAATSADLVVVSGGASVGERDLAVDALAAEGEVLFHGVRVKPGKPLLAGRIGGALCVGLPGNPTSALSNAALFVVPVARRLAGLPAAAPDVIEATIAEEVRGEPDRFLFLPVRLDGGRAVPTFKGSGKLTSLAASDGWIGVPEGETRPAGTRVQVTRW